MKRDYLVTYDICDDKRLRRTFEAVRGFGVHLQYSVFLCSLTERQHMELLAVLDEIIHHREDQVMVIDLGQSGARINPRITTLGKPGPDATDAPIII
jgi:CRISPR-associated protein Cas2